MPHTRLHPAFTFTEEHLAQLRAVVPEAFADGRVNWAAFRELLGERLEEESQAAEHFGLFWPGKRGARGLAATPSRGALVGLHGQGVNEEATGNFFVEGDNLEVLKLLQKAYAGRVKMIYIDPPYNTGSDLVYDDDYTDPLGDYLRKTGQVDEEGKPLTTNSRADGRFHSKWLSMMYPRLRLARELLSDEGLMFVSIDDNEVHHLRALMNEVFGEECFVGTIIWQKMDSPSRNDPDRAVTAYHDYIHVYARSVEEAAMRRKERPEIAEGYQITLSDGRLARRRQLRKNGKSARRQDRPTMWYPLTAPDGTRVWPVAPEGWEGRWALSRETWDQRERGGLTEWIKREYGWVPYVLETLPAELAIPWPTLWTEVDQNRQAKAKFTELMGSDIDFDNPKPTNLICEMLKMTAASDGVFLDFFAGSCSTAHAVMEQNRADGGTRRYIMIQLPVPTGQKKCDTIAEIGKERLRRAAKRMNKEAKPESNEDRGFRVLSLSTSVFRLWEEYTGQDLSELDSLFDNFENPLRSGWTPERLLVEVLLLEGFPLDSTVSRLGGLKGATVASVTSSHCGHRLLACFDAKIADDTLTGLDLQIEDIFICLDSALTDAQKLRVADRCNLKTI